MWISQVERAISPLGETDPKEKTVSTRSKDLEERWYHYETTLIAYLQAAKFDDNQKVEEFDDRMDKYRDIREKAAKVKDTISAGPSTSASAPSNNVGQLRTKIKVEQDNTKVLIRKMTSQFNRTDLTSHQIKGLIAQHGLILENVDNVFRNIYLGLMEEEIPSLMTA